MKKFALCLVPYALCLVLAACGGGSAPVDNAASTATPTVDYVEGLDVYSAPNKDSFLTQLAMNYRSFAIYNARTSGFPDIGELFANKAVAAFSGDTPVPESLDNWTISDPAINNEVSDAYRQLTDALRNDAAANQPELTAEAQAKFYCWIAAAASGQMPTALECRNRFDTAMAALSGNYTATVSRGGDSMMRTATIERYTMTQPGASQPTVPTYYPETANMRSMTDRSRSRDGIVIVNNVNIPQHLIQPEPVKPFVFNQNIVQGPNGGDPTVTSGPADVIPAPVPAPPPPPAPAPQPQFVAVPTYIPAQTDNMVTREEFTAMVMQLRAEMEQIRLAMANQPQQQMGGNSMDKTIIKIQQIPLQPNQKVMEEVLEIFFDFDKYIIKPEYEDVIRQLASAAQANRNIKVTVVGHTDTMGSEAYNFALGGRRATAVRNILIQYGIPASQIVAVSAGEKDLKVQTGDQVKKAENRRATIVKETAPDANGIATPNPQPVTVDFKSINKVIQMPAGATPPGTRGTCGATFCPPRPVQQFDVMDTTRPVGQPVVVYQ